MGAVTETALITQRSPEGSRRRAEARYELHKREVGEF